MSIGPTDLPLQPVLPSEGVRRVEGRADARDLPRRRQHEEEQDGQEDSEPQQDSVDLSLDYRMSHAAPDSPLPEEPSPDEVETPLLQAHVDIEA
jgi:hypothetical protein